MLGASAVIIAQIWRIENEPTQALLAGALALAHPFGADMWSFRLAPISFALALLSSLVALLLLRRTHSGYWLPVALFIASAGIYQTNINPLIIVVLFGILTDLLRPRAEETDKPPLRSWWAIVACILCSLALYLVANKIIMTVLKQPAEQRAGLLQLAEIAGRSGEVLNQLRRVLYGERQLGTGLLSAVQITLLLLGLGLVVARSVRSRAPRMIAWTLLIIGSALLATVGIVAMTRVFWPTPRVLTGAGFFWAGVFVVTSMLAGSRARNVSFVLAALLWIGWAGVDHRASDEQHRVNMRDMLRMSRVIGRLESHPGGASIHRVVIVNGPNGYGDMKTIIGDLNISAFFKDWSWAGLIAEAGGPPMIQPTIDDESHARTLCAQAGRWPAVDSVLIDKDVGIVCF
jgi:hypothetical protein